MAKSVKMVKVAMVVMAVCMVVAAPHVKGEITCGMVANGLAPCLGYLRSGGPVPGPCCSGVQSLYGAARTTNDRQEACRCMKAAAGYVTGINLALAAGLPSKCGVNIPYQISPSTDCSKVQ